MADATVQNCLDDARFHLGDNEVSGGQTYTNTVLVPFFDLAYRELFRVMQTLQIPRVRNEAYYNLPAHTGYLAPVTASITDMGEPEIVEERGVGVSKTITGCTISGGVPTITATAHGLDTGARVVVWGVGGISGVAGSWGITKTDADNFTLNGAVASGTYTSGGTVSTSTEAFTLLEWEDRILEAEGSADDKLYRVAWVQDVFRFPTCSSARQLRIVYLSSGTAIASVSSSIAMDDARDYLVLRTAGLAALSRGAIERAQILNALAIGPKQTEADGSGGVLRQLVVAAVRRLPPVRRPPFREPRSILPEIY